MQYLTVYVYYNFGKHILKSYYLLRSMSIDALMYLLNGSKIPFTCMFL